MMGKAWILAMAVAMAMALPAPAQAQDAAPDAAPDAMDGYPLEATYADTSADLPREGMGDGVATPSAPPMLLDTKGQPARFQIIALEPGQTLLFRIDGDGKATDVRLVDADTPPADGEIRATMSSMGGNTSLEVLNKGPMSYNYEAFLMEKLESTEGAPTSVCTLLPGLTAFEMWPYPVAAIAIGGFTPAPDGAMTCK